MACPHTHMASGVDSGGVTTDGADSLVLVFMVPVKRRAAGRETTNATTAYHSD